MALSRIDFSNHSNASDKQRMKGMKIRDEFICPITCELMREPVVASDGHTYEKSAIEKWLKTNNISPRSGEPIESLTLSNINLKKLIQDIIDEGGAGFYTKDNTDKERTFEVRPEKVLILECLGPPESEWYEQSFQVSKSGCIGGRRQQLEDAQSKDIIIFKDITVSRRHFEITHVMEGLGNDKFCIRDLGSAGGTFIRLPFGTKKQLHPGMIVLLGKHQFTVSSIDDSGSDSSTSNAAASKTVALSTSSKSGDNLAAGGAAVSTANKILSLVEARMLTCDFSSKDDQDAVSARLRSLSLEISSRLSNHDSIDELGEYAVEVDENGGDVKKGYECSAKYYGISASCKSDSSSEIADEKRSSLSHHGSGSKSSLRRCTLTCCAPDGSPLQGRSFVVGPEGANLGRKQTNDICLFIKVSEMDELTQERVERVVNVDTAISAEHARVEFDEKSGSFFISDGTSSKSSTNGTWYRLSGPHQESPPNAISAGSEVLIGTVRFQVRESMTIAEHKLEKADISPNNDSKIMNTNHRHDSTDANEDNSILS